MWRTNFSTKRKLQLISSQYKTIFFEVFIDLTTISSKILLLFVLLMNENKIDNKEIFEKNRKWIAMETFNKVMVYFSIILFHQIYLGELIW